VPETDCEGFVTRLTSLFGRIEEEIIRQGLAGRRKAGMMLEARFMEWMNNWHGHAKSRYAWPWLRQYFFSRLYAVRHKLGKTKLRYAWYWLRRLYFSRLDNHLV